MSNWVRHAIYWVPEGELGDWGAAWLGWDIRAGVAVTQRAPPEVPVAEPARYGFHATLKPPFRLAAGHDVGDLSAALAGVAATLPAPGEVRLGLARLGRFLALVPVGDVAPLAALAAALVADLDRFRAPPAPADLARRRQVGLSAAEEANLLRWGYPYVMDEFRLHLTLTGPLDEAGRARAWTALEPDLAQRLAAPIRFDHVAHVAEAPDGRFHLLRQHRLHG